ALSASHPFGGLVLPAWLSYSDSWRILSCPRRAAEEVVNLSRIRHLSSPRENTTFENTSDKMAAARKKGKYIGGQPILGYDVDRSASRLVVNAQEAARVRQIFALYLERQSLLATIAELDQRDWVTKRWTTQKGKQRGGKPFTKNSLHSLLTNITYVGKVRYKDDVYPGEHE